MFPIRRDFRLKIIKDLLRLDNIHTKMVYLCCPVSNFDPNTCYLQDDPARSRYENESDKENTGLYCYCAYSRFCKGNPQNALGNLLIFILY